MSRRPTLHAASLRYLTEIARLGSIRRASVTLNIAASAINRQVLKIERDLGAKLFDRMPGGMRLTPAGDVLLRHVRDTLHNYDRSLAEIDGLQGIRSGHVGLLALDSLLVDFVPRALDGVARQYPAVTFSALAASPAAILHGVAAGQADIGLTFVTPTSPALQLAASIPAPLGVLMAPDHPLASRASLGFADLGQHPVLLQDEALPAASLIEDEFAAFRAAIRPRFVSNSIELQRQLVRAGLGVACFTRLGFRREIASGDLVWIPLAVPRLRELRIGLFIPAQRTLSPAAAQVVGALAKDLAELEQLP